MVFRLWVGGVIDSDSPKFRQRVDGLQQFLGKRLMTEKTGLKSLVE